jgi:membrane protein DedA with SNARE-associated domain
MTTHLVLQAASDPVVLAGFMGTVGKIAAATVLFFIAVGLIIGLLLGFFVGRAVGRRQGSNL